MPGATFGGELRGGPCRPSTGRSRAHQIHSKGFPALAASGPRSAIGEQNLEAMPAAAGWAFAENHTRSKAFANIPKGRGVRLGESVATDTVGSEAGRTEEHEDSALQTPGRPGRARMAWMRGTKPTDLLLVLTAAVSIVVSVIALQRSDQVAALQQAESSPVLAPGTDLADRGRVMTIATETTTVRKRADWLFIDRRAGRLVIPLRNGGNGIAMIVGRPVLVENCTLEPQRLPLSTTGALGTYIIPSGGSDQLAWLARKSDVAGTVRVGNESFWYSFDYAHFGRIGNSKSGPPSLVVWYTDGAQAKLRWSCMTFFRASGNNRMSEWAVEGVVYGARSALLSPFPAS